MNFQFKIFKHLKNQRGEMATLLTIVSLGLMLVGVAAGTFMARRTGKPLEMFPVEGNSCTNEGAWEVNCTQNVVCPTDNNLMVGVPLRCENGKWVNKNPAGECSHSCPNQNPPSPEQRTPTATPAVTGECTNGQWKYHCTQNLCPDPNNKVMVGVPYLCEGGKWVNKNPAGECTDDCPRPTSSPSTAPTPGDAGPTNPPNPPVPGAFHLGAEIFTYPKAEGAVEFVFHVKFFSDGCVGHIALFRNGNLVGKNLWTTPDQPWVYPQSDDNYPIIVEKEKSATVNYRGTVDFCPNQSTLENSITCTVSVKADGNPEIKGTGCNWNNQGSFIPPGPGPGTPGPTGPGGGGEVCGNACMQCKIEKRGDVDVFNHYLGMNDPDNPYWSITTCDGKMAIINNWCAVSPLEDNDPDYGKYATDCERVEKTICIDKCGSAPLPTSVPTAAPTSPPVGVCEQCIPNADKCSDVKKVSDPGNNKYCLSTYQCCKSETTPTTPPGTTTAPTVAPTAIPTPSKGFSGNVTVNGRLGEYIHIQSVGSAYDPSKTVATIKTTPDDKTNKTFPWSWDGAENGKEYTLKAGVFWKEEYYGWSSNSTPVKAPSVVNFTIASTLPEADGRCNTPDPDKCVNAWFSSCGTGFESVGKLPGCSGPVSKCCKPIPTSTPTPSSTGGGPPPTALPTAILADAGQVTPIARAYGNVDFDAVSDGLKTGLYNIQQVIAWLNEATRYPGTQIVFFTPENIVTPSPAAL